MTPKTQELHLLHNPSLQWPGVYTTFHATKCGVLIVILSLRLDTEKLLANFGGQNSYFAWSKMCDLTPRSL